MDGFPRHGVENHGRGRGYGSGRGRGRDRNGRGEVGWGSTNFRLGDHTRRPRSSGPSSSSISKRQPSRSVIVVREPPPSRRPERRAPAPTGEHVCYVNAETNIKSSAGYVSNMIREGSPPVVYAISAHNANQALKMLALAHSYLEDEGRDLYAQIDFPEYADNQMSANVALHVFQKSERSSLAHVSQQIFVSGTSEPSKVATFISESLRESSLGRVCVTAAGPHPMLRALKAIFVARHLASERGSDLSVVPEFGKSEEGLSLVNIFVIEHQAQTPI